MLIHLILITGLQSYLKKKIYNHIKPKAQFSLRVMEKNGIRNVSNTSHIWSGNKILSKCSSDLTLLPPTLETKLILEGKDEKIDRFQSQQKSVFLIWVFQLWLSKFYSKPPCFVSMVWFWGPCWIHVQWQHHYFPGILTAVCWLVS